MTYSKFRPNQNSKGGKFRGNNNNKIERKKQVVFDLEQRKEFLTGFHKRKLQKKAKYRAMIERKVVQEKQRIKEKVLNSTTKTTSSDSILPEVEELLKREEEEKSLTQVDEFSVGSKTVVISTLNPMIKPLPEDIDEELNEDEEIEGEGGEDEESTKKTADRKLVSKLKRSANSMLQASKFFKASQRLKCKKNKRKMQMQNRKAGAKPTKGDKKDKDAASTSKKGSKGGNKFSKGGRKGKK